MPNLSEDDVVKRCSYSAVQAEWRYHRQARVVEFARSGDTIRSAVERSERQPYRQTIMLAARRDSVRVDGRCTCPVGANCIRVDIGPAPYGIGKRRNQIGPAEGTPKIGTAAISPTQPNSTAIGSYNTATCEGSVVIGRGGTASGNGSYVYGAGANDNGRNFYEGTASGGFVLRGTQLLSATAARTGATAVTAFGGATVCIPDSTAWGIRINLLARETNNGANTYSWALPSGTLSRNIGTATIFFFGTNPTSSFSGTGSAANVSTGYNTQTGCLIFTFTPPARQHRHLARRHDPRNDLGTVTR